MATIQERYRAIFGQGRETERVVFFSDAVFAIALTLLVIDLRVPAEDNGETSGDVIVGLLPGFLAYVISFGVIAVNWLAHHRKFQVIKKYDGRLLLLNFLLLFLIALLPFPTSLMSEYPGEIPSVVLYASLVILLNLAQFGLWSYAFRRGFMDVTIDLEMYRYVRRNLLVVPVVFGISIFIAIFWNATYAMYFWIILWPVSEVISRLAVRKPRNAAQAVTSSVDTESSAPGTSA